MASYKTFVVSLAKQYNPENDNLSSENSHGNYDDVFDDGVRCGRSLVYGEAAEFLAALNDKKKAVVVKQEAVEEHNTLLAEKAL